MLALRAPFRRQGFCERKRRRGKRSARRRLHRPSIERKTEAALAFRNADLLVKAAPQLRACAAARPLAWIERLVAEQLLENVAHRKSPAAFAPHFPQRMTWTWRRAAGESTLATRGACEESASRSCTRRKRLRPKRRGDARKRLCDVSCSATRRQGSSQRTISSIASDAGTYRRGALAEIASNSTSRKTIHFFKDLQARGRILRKEYVYDSGNLWPRCTAIKVTSFKPLL